MKPATPLEAVLKTLPDQPGVYQYFDEKGTIIYVGKAKNLRKRVHSYFNRDHLDSTKTRLLVKAIKRIEFTVVDTETDALLLESSLIKQHQPRFNINLKDDKSYPWICITNEAFPRVLPTRRVIRDGSVYYGPYASVPTMYALLDLIKQLFPLRTCTFSLTPQNITNGKYKVCLEYHIKNCLGPCENRQTEIDYDRNIHHIRNILSGHLAQVLRNLKEQMNQAAEDLEFERAHFIKTRMELLEKYQSRSAVVSPTVSNVDVLALAEDGESAYVNYLQVIEGTVVHAQTVELRKRLDESPDELLTFAVMTMRQRFSSKAPELLLPFPLPYPIPGCEVTVPQRGDKKKLLDLSQKNADQYRRDRQKQLALTNPEAHTERIMNQMQRDLRLTAQPRRMECFDNSNMHGNHAVSAMTVFVDGKPSKKDYRHFNVKTVIGPDDFATMREVILRRYQRVLEEQQPLPDLIVIDGGKGQLSAALESLEQLGLRGKVGIIGIAKRLEEIYYPGDSLPLYLDKKSETLRILQQIRDEAHRFGITHHRTRRDNATLHTELTRINGISDKSAQALLRALGSVARIKAATLEELAGIIGQAKAKKVFDFLQSVEPID